MNLFRTKIRTPFSHSIFSGYATNINIVFNLSLVVLSRSTRIHQNLLESSGVRQDIRFQGLIFTIFFQFPRFFVVLSEFLWILGFNVVLFFPFITIDFVKKLLFFKIKANSHLVFYKFYTEYTLVFISDYLRKMNVLLIFSPIKNL